MKKTLFLGAVLGAALCSSAFATNYTAISAGQTITTAAGDTIANNIVMNNGSTFVIGGATTASGNIKVSNGSSATITDTNSQLSFVGTNGYDLQLDGTSNLTLSGGHYDLTASQVGVAVNAGSTLTLTNGASIRTKDVMYSSIGVANNGKVIVEDGSSLVITSNHTTNKNVDVTYTRLSDLVVAGTVEINNTNTSIVARNKAEFNNLNIDGGSMSITNVVATVANLTLANSGTLTVNAGTTLNLTLGTEYITEEHDRATGNGLGTASYSRDFEGGLINNGGTINANGISATLSEGVLNASGNSETYYINETAASYDFTGAKKLVVRAAAGNLTGLGNMQTLTFEGGSASIGATGQEIKGDVIIKNGSTVGVTSTDGLSYSVSGKSITVEKGGELAFGNKRFTMGHYTLKMQGGTVSGVGEETYGALDFNSTDGKIVASGTDESTISANVRLRASIDIEVQEGAKLTMSGLINQNGDNKQGFTKVGAGELVLSHDNTFAGGVTINAGTVTAAAATALGTGAVTVNQGATLAAADGVSMTINTLTLNGGTVAFGSDDDGTLTSSALTINGDSTINANLVIADNGTVTFTEGSVTLGCSIKFGENSTVALGTAYESSLKENGHVLLFTGVDEIIGDLSTVAVTGNFVSGHLYSVEQEDGSHNIYATPEPATATLSLLALAGLMARRKRH